MPHNVGSVVSDIEDVKNDLRSQLRRRVTQAMRVLEADARTYIKRDADWRGHLARSLSMDVQERTDGAEIVVSVGGRKAPYAPFIEFGTGARSEQTTSQAPSSGIVYEPDSYPPTFPYSSPDLSPGMVANIIEWVETKPVSGSDDVSDEELGYRIAATIANRGTYAHPFMRPAWFQNERRIRNAAHNALRKAVR
jgi:HK97 gp10 family phage protein